MHSIESLVYSPECIEAIAYHTQEESDAAKMIASAKEEAIDALKETGVDEHMASHRACYSTRKEIFSKLPTRKNIKEMDDTISLGHTINPYKSEFDAFRRLRDVGDWETIIRDYPIKQSNAPEKIANALGMDKSLYEKNLVSILKGDKDLANKLKQYIDTEMRETLL